MYMTAHAMRMCLPRSWYSVHTHSQHATYSSQHAGEVQVGRYDYLAYANSRVRGLDRQLVKIIPLLSD